MTGTPSRVRQLWMTVGGLSPEAVAAVDTALYIPAPEVVSELEKSGLPIQAMAFLTAASVETLLPGPGGAPLAWPYSWSVFRCEFGFTEWTGSLSVFPPWGGVSLADGTHTSAIGTWQDEEATDTWLSQITGDTGFEPQDQIKKNWVLATTEYETHTNGGNLLSVLTGGSAAELATISPALIAIWPEGCDANFPARYTAALAMYQAAPPLPAPPPSPPQPGPPPMPDTISIPVGYQESYAITGSLNGTAEPVPADALNSSAPAICSVTVAEGEAVFSGLALGSAVVTAGAGVVLVDTGGNQISQLDITVVAAVPKSPRDRPFQRHALPDRGTGLENGRGDAAGDRYVRHPGRGSLDAGFRIGGDRGKATDRRVQRLDVLLRAGSAWSRWHDAGSTILRVEGAPFQCLASQLDGAGDLVASPRTLIVADSARS